MEDKLQDLLATQHTEWLKHPVTVAALKRINEHKDKFVKIISQDAQNSNVQDSAYRHSGINIRNTDAILSLLTNTSLFLNNTTKQQ